MLMSAPPGLGWPGYITRLSGQNKDVRLNRTYHTSERKWLPVDKTPFSLMVGVAYQTEATHMKIGLNKRRFADWNIVCRVDFRMCVRSAIIVKNGQVDKVGTIAFTLGQRTDPCLR